MNTKSHKGKHPSDSSKQFRYDPIQYDGRNWTCSKSIQIQDIDLNLKYKIIYIHKEKFILNATIDRERP